MNNEKGVKDKFIDWCSYIHPDVNPYIFIQRYNRYSDEYSLFLIDLMTELHHYISEKLPNIDFSFKGRIKSPRSFLIKTFRTMSENIENLFPDKYPTDPVELQELLEKRDKNITKHFKFLLKTGHIDRFNEIKDIIENTPHELGTLDGFRYLFNKLSKYEKDSLVTRLGRTEDTFANRFIVSSIDFPIKSIAKVDSNNSINLLDKDWNSIPLLPAITFKPSDIKTDSKTGIRYVTVNNKTYEITEHNLLYPRDLPANKRKLENALVNPNGEITLLQDALIINNSEYFNIVSAERNAFGDILLHNEFGESKNLNLLLNTDKNINLRKVDRNYTNKYALYPIRKSMREFYDNNYITWISSRSKDYVKNPKEDSKYQSLHDSFVSKTERLFFRITNS